VVCSDANAVAQVDISGAHSRVDGFIPTGWYPTAVTALPNTGLAILNGKGLGSHPNPGGPNPTKSAAQVHAQSSPVEYVGHIQKGTAQFVTMPSDEEIATDTHTVVTNSPYKDEILYGPITDEQTAYFAKSDGHLSPIQHVIYIIKENRTYDQVLGDIGKGNSDPNLCIFGKDVTPNHHALANEFALLDNYYCNSVLSADGHAWAVEGTTVDYLEKSFGAWIRSYPFPGNDALAIAPSGFIWDDALEHGLTFRNFGEMSTTAIVPQSRFAEIYQDHQRGANKIKFIQTMANAHLKQYSCPDSPGWNLRVPDQVRADIFLKEFAGMQKSGNFPNLTVIYLPSDHTSGIAPGGAAPQAMVADNDLAVGRIVEAISHSQFWKSTCIFVAEDDPQAGFDHVDGHRSFALVISPYTKRGAVISKFYNQTSVLHTMELMLGLPPMNQMDAMAPVMWNVFNNEADLTAYHCKPNTVPIDLTNKAKAAMTAAELKLAEQSEAMRIDIPDAADENTLNRILWASMKGTDAAYPVAFAGAHGKGLAELHLKLDKGVKDDDDD
jgi:hypothetical protein